MTLSGKVWKINNDCSATDLAPARYDYLFAKRQYDEVAKHVLEDMIPDFAKEVQKGDIIIVNGTLGAGHNHYHPNAIFGSKAAGVGAIFAEKVNPLFQHQAIDGGFPILVVKGLDSLVENGDEIEVDLKKGEAKNLSTGASLQIDSASDIILDILGAGGSEEWTFRRMGITVTN